MTMRKRKYPHVSKKQKENVKIVNVTEPTEDDEYMSRVDAEVYRVALKMAKRRKRLGYIV
jgi:hypothetical protein